MTFRFLRPFQILRNVKGRKWQAHLPAGYPGVEHGELVIFIEQFNDFGCYVLLPSGHVCPANLACLQSSDWFSEVA